MAPTLTIVLVAMDIICCAGLGFLAAAVRYMLPVQSELGRFVADFFAVFLALVLAQSYAAQTSNAGLLRFYMIVFLGVGALAFVKVLAPYQLFLVGFIQCIIAVPLHMIAHKLIGPAFFVGKKWTVKQKEKINVKNAKKTQEKQLQNPTVLLYNSNMEFYTMAK